MPPKPAAKTESVPDSQPLRRLLYPLGIAVIVASGLIGGLLLQRRAAKTFLVDGQQLTVEVVETEAAKMHGLSDKVGMPRDHGMLFAYDKPGGYCLWMKDMHFPLDMLWLDEDKRIVTIHENVAPDTYPQNFCPEHPAQYMLEVNAGTVQAAGVRVGDRLSVP